MPVLGRHLYFLNQVLPAKLITVVHTRVILITLVIDNVLVEVWSSIGEIVVPCSGYLTLLRVNGGQQEHVHAGRTCHDYRCTRTTTATVTQHLHTAFFSTVVHISYEHLVLHGTHRDHVSDVCVWIPYGCRDCYEICSLQHKASNILGKFHIVADQ